MRRTFHVRFFQIQLRYSQAPGWGPGRGTKATVEHYPDIMQKLFDAAVDYPLVLIPANEEFPRSCAVDDESATLKTGWSAGFTLLKEGGDGMSCGN